MNRITRLAGLAGTLVIFGVGAAQAADIVAPVEDVYVPPVVADVFTWSGFYVGANVGYGWGEADHVDEDGFLGNSGINDLDIDGAFAGGQIGYNWQFNQIVVGAEADLQWSGIEGSCGAGECAGGLGPPATSHEIDWFGTVRARLGYAAGDWMPYITGGYAFGEATRETAASGGESQSEMHHGWVAGAGVEWAFAPDWSAKAEYQYLDLGDERFVFDGLGADPRVDLQIHTVRVGVNWHFN